MNLPINITLNATEIAHAGTVGMRRYIESTLKGRDDVVGLSDGWNNNIEGAIAEFAVAKALDLHYDPALGKFGEADVGPWHVRSTNHKNGRLRIAPKEEHGKYLLVIGQFDSWSIVGWIDAEHGRKEEWFCSLRNDRKYKNYWIPQESLIKEI